MTEMELKKYASELTNKEILSKITVAEYGDLFFTVDPVEVRDMVNEYVSKNHAPYKASIESEVLYMNGTALGRIMAMPKASVSEDSYYWEGAILARQGL